MTKPIAEPTPRACAACPWRLSNQGTPHPHGFYSTANLRRLWNGLRLGNAPGMTCHPTDPRMAEFEGYEKTAEREQAHECAGSIVLLVREAQRLQAFCLDVEDEEAAGVALRAGEALRRYRAAVRSPLSRGVLADVVWRFLAGGTPIARSLGAVTPDSVNDPDVGYPAGLGDWDPAILARAQGQS